MQENQNNRSKILLSAVIIGIIMLCVTWGYIGKTAGSVNSSTSNGIGTGIAMIMVMPHQILATLACLFAFIGWLLRARWGALVAAILYTVALVLMIPWFYAVIIQMILCYVAYSKMSK